MKQIYTNENRLLAMNTKNLLENAGINVQLKNEFGSDGSTLGNQAWLELWVGNSDYKRSMALLESINSMAETKWICRSCHEENTAAFQICWQCQQEMSA